MAFFPSSDTKFTLVPNVFYDEILLGENTTLNEKKLFIYILRNNLSTNNSNAWTDISGKKLINKAKISYESISSTIASCIEKKWILDFNISAFDREEKYLFLNTSVNHKIIYCLTKGLFDISHLKKLNEKEIKALLEQHYCLEVV